MNHPSHSRHLGQPRAERILPACKTLVLAIAIALAIPGAAAMAGEPIPGVDVKLGKNPRGIPVVVPIDASGRFNLRITERGGYTLSTACRLPAGCLPHAVVNASGGVLASETRRIDIRIVALGAGEKAGTTRFDFSVDARPVVIGGEFHGGAPGLAAIPGPADLNQDGRPELGAGHAPKPTSSGTGQSFPIGNLGTIAAPGAGGLPAGSGGSLPAGVLPARRGEAFKVADNESPRPTDRAAAKVGPGELSLPENSNARSGIAEAGDALGQVSTTRGTAPRPQGGEVKPGVAEKEANDVLMQVSTTRGTAPRPQGGDVKPGVADTEATSALSQVSTTRGTAPRPQGGDVTPGIAETNSPMGNVSTTRGIVPNPTPINDAPSIFDRWGVRGGGLPNQGSAQFPGKSIAGIQIGIVAESGGAKASALTDARGAFQFTRLPAGKYALSIPGEPAQSVMVGPGGTLNGDLKLSSAGTLHVTSFSFGAAAPTNGSGAAKRSADFGSAGNLGFGVNSGALGGVIPGGVMIPGGAMAPGSAMGGAR